MVKAEISLSVAEAVVCGPRAFPFLSWVEGGRHDPQGALCLDAAWTDASVCWEAEPFANREIRRGECKQ